MALRRPTRFHWSRPESKVWKADGSLEKELGALSDIGTKVTVTSGDPVVIAGDWSGQISVYDLAKSAQLGQLNSNRAIVTTHRACQAGSRCCKKKEQEILLEKDKAAKNEADPSTSSPQPIKVLAMQVLSKNRRRLQ